MSAADRRSRVVAVTLATAGSILVIVSLLIWGAGGFRPLPTSFARGALGVSASSVAALAYLGAGSLLSSRLARNPIGWLLLLMGLVFAVMTPTALLVDAAHRALRPAPAGTELLAWVVSSFSGPILAGSGILTGLLFPDGRLSGPRWRWALVLAVGGSVLLAAGIALRPGGLVWYPTLANPFAAQAIAPLVTAAAALGVVVLSGTAALMVASLFGRYRRGDGTVRAQLRWILFAGAVQPAVLGPFMLARFVTPVGEALGEMLLAVANITMALVPIAAAFAILRYRLFGIDLIINRTLVYLPMMAILGGLYTASIAIFQRLFVAVTGESSDVPLIIALFLLATAFTPLRKALEGLAQRWTRVPGTSAGQPSVPAGLTPAIAEAAAAVVALHRLEERVAASTETGVGSGARRIEIDADARVACPLGGRPHFVACLGCRYFDLLAISPPCVLCTAPSGDEAMSLSSIG